MDLYSSQAQAGTRPLPNPQRMTDRNGCLLPKVFVAYPHNPLEYTMVTDDIQQYREWYPGEPDEVLRQSIQRIVQDNEQKQKAVIDVHQSKVYSFVKILQEAGVAVAYDQLLTDVGSDNIMRWCQEQIDNSDIVILIVTESFNMFLNGEPPPESEHLFVGNYLSNFVNNPPPGKLLIPVFLDRPVNSQLIPKCLEMSRLYSVSTPPVLGRGGDFDALYALLTKQDRFAPPTPRTDAAPIQLNRRRRIGAGITSDIVQRDSASLVSATHHRHLLDSLLRLQCPLPDNIITTVSDKPLFHDHWRQLAMHLGLSPAQIERCEAIGHRDEAENCLQMLKTWRNAYMDAATVAALADAVYNKHKSPNMLEILYFACQKCMPMP